MTTTCYRLRHDERTLTGSAEKIAREILRQRGAFRPADALLADTIREVEYHGEPVDTSEPFPSRYLARGGDDVMVKDGRPVTRKTDLKHATLVRVTGAVNRPNGWDARGALQSQRFLVTEDGTELEPVNERSRVYVVRRDADAGRF